MKCGGKFPWVAISFTVTRSPCGVGQSRTIKSENLLSMWGIIHKKQLTASGLRSCNSRSLSKQKFPLAHPAALNPITTPPLPEQIELHRYRMWRRDEDLRVESAVDAE